MSEKKFKSLMKSIAKEYIKKGDSKKKANAIGKATAGEIAWKHKLKKRKRKCK